MNDIIYFNHASSGRMSDEVISTISYYLNFEKKHGAHAITQNFSFEINQLYSDTAKLINASSDEIAIFDSATTASIALLSSIKWKSKDRILITTAEYGSLYLAWLQLFKEKQIIIDILPLVDHNTIDLNMLKAYLTEQHRLVSLPIIPSHGGTVDNLSEISFWLKSQHCYLLLDAAQAVGHIPINLDVTPCDFLVATGKKYLQGPSGCGFLYIKQSNIADLTPRFAHLMNVRFNENHTNFEFNNTAQIFEYGQSNYALRFGLQKAIENYLQQDQLQAYQTIVSLVNYFIENLSEYKQLKILKFNTNTGILCYEGIGIDVEKLCKQLSTIALRPIFCTAWSSICSPLIMPQLNGKKLMRFSIHYTNTKEEIDHLSSVLKHLIK